MRVRAEVLGEVIDTARELELLLARLGGEGSGLHERLGSLEGRLSPEALRQGRLVASVRNRVAHEAGYYPDEAELGRFRAAADGLRRAVESGARTPVHAPLYSPAPVASGGAPAVAAERLHYDFRSGEVAPLLGDAAVSPHGGAATPEEELAPTAKARAAWRPDRGYAVRAPATLWLLLVGLTVALLAGDPTLELPGDLREVVSPTQNWAAWMWPALLWGYLALLAVPGLNVAVAVLGLLLGGVLLGGFGYALGGAGGAMLFAAIALLLHILLMLLAPRGYWPWRLANNVSLAAGLAALAAGALYLLWEGLQWLLGTWRPPA